MPTSFFSFARFPLSSPNDNSINLAPELGEVLCPPGTLLFSGVFCALLVRPLQSARCLSHDLALPILWRRQFRHFGFFARMPDRANR